MLRRAEPGAGIGLVVEVRQEPMYQAPATPTTLRAFAQRFGQAVIDGIGKVEGSS